MNVYSDFLFHFTGRNNDGFGNLLSILEKGFRFSNNNPVMPIDSLNRDTVYEYRPGMICFTDIPFKLIPRHAVKYGKFGIGMKKTWGIEAGAQPVLYTIKESLYYKSLQTFNSGIDILVEKKHFSPEIVDINILGKLITLLFKAFDGLHGITQDYSCYDEREWRVIRDQDNDYQKLSIYYDDIYDVLKFKASDIVLLVAPEQYILDLKQHVAKIYKTKGQEVMFPVIPFEFIDVM